MWRRIRALVRMVAAVLVPVAVVPVVLLLWEFRELEDGAALGVGEHPVEVDVEQADAVVSYTLPEVGEKADSNR